MHENPYQASQAPQRAAGTEPRWWLVWLGLIALAMAAVLAGLGIFGMFLSYNSIATSTDAPQPAELAQGISTSTFPILIAAPLGLLGLILVVVGLVARRRVE